MTPHPPRRSVLFVPAARPRALARARQAGADALIFDLEDSAGPDEKDAAREAVAALLEREPSWPEVERCVRVNGFGTPAQRADLERLARAPVAALVLPKVDDPRTIQAAEAELDRVGAPATLRLWAMIESPRGVLALERIAAASPRLEALILGPNDLLRALGATDDRAALAFTRSRLVTVARAFGLDPLDGIVGALDDPEGLEETSRHGRALGFSGRTLIHPRMVEAANRAYGVDAEALARAHRILSAWAARDGHGVVRVDDRMVEAMHAAEAEALVARAAELDRRARLRA